MPFLLIVLFASCNKEKALIENHWVIIDGTYKGQPIIFNENGISLIFFENHRAILPGIDCETIHANWELIDGKIRFLVDSSRYQTYRNEKKEQLRSALSDSLRIIEEQNSNTFRNVEQEKLSKAMKIYGELFAFETSKDSLKLTSQNAFIRPERVRTITELLEGI